MPRQTITELCAIKPEALKAGKLKISPVGEATGLDGRVFHIDGQTITQRLIDTGLELVLNVAHEYGGQAAGWFSEFESREDGIYARLALNEHGTALLDAQAYKYLSPEYFINDADQQVWRLVGVGLVNQPNLLSDALNQAAPPTDPDARMDAGGRAAYGTARLSSPNAKADPYRDVGGRAAYGTKAEETRMTQNTENTETSQAADRLTQQNQQLARENAALKRQIHAHKVDAAIAERKLIPAKREFALGLNANALDAYLKVEAESRPQTDKQGIQPDETQAGDGGCPILSQLNIEDQQDG